MRTTLVVNDPIYRRARQQAQRRKVPLSHLMNQALDLYLAELEGEATEPAPPAPELPSFRMGVPTVDINDRDALLQCMEGPA